MIITAHGGALKTGRNSKLYFEKIKNYAVDAIEVDIMKKGDLLYLSHSFPKLFAKRAISMEFVLDFCKKYDKMVNCDVKRPGLVKPVLDLAKKMDAVDNIYFTGFVLPCEIKNLDGGLFFANDTFLMPKYKFTVEQLPKIKDYLDSFNNKHITGINVDYKKIDKEFLNKARELGVNLSIYTVDDEEKLQEIMAYAPYNVTTNIVDKALEIAGK